MSVVGADSESFKLTLTDGMDDCVYNFSAKSRSNFGTIRPLAHALEEIASSAE